MIVSFNEYLTLYIIFPLVVLVGIYFSYSLRFVQFRKFSKSLSLLTTKSKKGSMSSFSAMAAILGGNLGTGNISGVAIALSAGGPGAIFWMWIMVFLAAITKYVGCFLGVHFQTKNKIGEVVAGPMFYIQKGLGLKWLSMLFCLFTIFASLTVGNIVQVHALSMPISELGISPLFISMPLALLVGSVLLGGLKRFASVLSSVVPAMAILYVLSCIIILVMYRENLLPSINLIIDSAFKKQSAGGGILGFSVSMAIKAGFNRGLFATDSGIGLAPMLHGAVVSTEEDDNRITQGLISLISPFIVMIVCTLTGLVLLTTNAHEISSMSTLVCMEAFRRGFHSVYAGQIVSVTLFFFAFTTILTWAFCGMRAAEYLFGITYAKIFYALFVFLIPFGIFLEENIIWDMADISINFMFIINMIAIVFLSPIVIKETKFFLDKNKI